MGVRPWGTGSKPKSTEISLSQYHIIVNPARREYLDVGILGNNKASGYATHWTSEALSVLVCNSSQVFAEPKMHGRMPALAGLWCGDAVYAAGDGFGAPNDFGIITTTSENPDRNLYWLAKEEFKDITYPAIAMLCQLHESTAEEMGSRAERDRYWLVHLGNTVFTVGCHPLEEALRKTLGNDWKRKYKAAADR